MFACTAETASGDLDWIEDDHGEGEDEFRAVSVGGILFTHVRCTSDASQDAMGSVIAMADGSGASTASIEYDAFGNVTSSSGSAAAIPSSVGTDFRYHGMQLDTASGLYHVRARTYDARTGRFTSRDPVSGGRLFVETYHPYAFANGNPHVFADPSGRSVLSLSEISIGLVVAAVIAAIAIPTFAAYVYEQLIKAKEQADWMRRTNRPPAPAPSDPDDTAPRPHPIPDLTDPDTDEDDPETMHHYTDDPGGFRSYRAARGGTYWTDLGRLSPEAAYRMLGIGKANSSRALPTHRVETPYDATNFEHGPPLPRFGLIDWLRQWTNIDPIPLSKLSINEI